MTGLSTARPDLAIGSLPTPPWSLVSCRSATGPYAAVRDAGGVVRALPRELATASLLSLLDHWEAVAPRLADLDPESLEPIPDARLDIPLRFPPKLICAGANYYSHAAEMGGPVPDGARPYFFLKPPSTTLVTDGETIPIGPEQVQVDWEAELGVVIGRRARRLSRSQAPEVVAGYVVLNDVTDRARLRREPPVLAPPFAFDWLSAKGLDASCPIGVGVVPAHLVADPHLLRLRLWVNGVLQQDGSTADMVADIPALLEAISAVMTLEPGDIMATGTPAGVGAARELFLRPGDVMTAEVEYVGTVTNTVIRAPG